MHFRFWTRMKLLRILFVLSVLVILPTESRADALDVTVLRWIGWLPPENNSSLASFLKQYVSTRPPIVTLELASLYTNESQREALHPMFDLRLVQGPHSQRCSDETTRKSTLQYRVEDCKGGCFALDGAHESMSLDKEMRLLESQNRNAELPPDFLAHPPALNEWGTSFARLMIAEKDSPYANRRWVEEHLSYFRISELNDVMVKFGIEDQRYKTLAGLDNNEIEHLIRGNPIAGGPTRILIRDQSGYELSPLRYFAYPIGDFLVALAQTPYEIRAITGDEGYCIERVGDWCWTYNSQQVFSQIHSYSKWIFLSFAALALSVVALLARLIWRKAREQRRSQLSVQVLAHEFRTPVASLVLLIDQLNEHRKILESDPNMGDVVARAASEIFRLQRTVELSRNYLVSGAGRTPFRFDLVTDFQQWLAECIEDFGWQDSVLIECESEQVSAVIDPFWMRFVIQNLIQNAFDHGKAPILIRLVLFGSSLRVIVEDRGEAEFKSLRVMTSPYVKSSRSRGMGLGLNIVKTVVQEWGSQLKFAPNPTRFSFTVPRSH